MKKSIAIFLVVNLLILSICGCDDKANLNIKIHDMGISTASNEALSLNARNIWDITTMYNNIYVATGDFDNDAGPTSIWKYDFNSLEWVDSGEFMQEAIVRFVKSGNRMFAVGADPIGRPKYAEVYFLENNQWQIFAKIKEALHIFDLECFKGDVFFGVSYENDEYPIVRFIPKTNEYINIPLYKNGVDIIKSIQGIEETNYKRVYDLFSLNGRLYCVLSITYKNGKTTIEFYELSGNVFVFRQSYKNSGMQMNKLVSNQLLFNADAVSGNNCYISLGNLYRTNDFFVFNHINIPDNACVTDLEVDKNNKNDVLYVLTVSPKNGAFKNTIYLLNGERLTEVCSFIYNCSALCLTKKMMLFMWALVGMDNAQIILVEC